MKLKIFTLVLALLAGSAFAQSGPYAKFEAVEGNVSVFDNGKSSVASKGMALAEGALVKNDSSATSTVSFKDGCTVKLEKGQVFKVKAAGCACLADDDDFERMSPAVVDVSGSAQDRPYAKFEAVEGMVTVSNNKQLVTGTKGMALEEGVIVTNSSSATSTISFRDGCAVKLKNSQTFKVKASGCGCVALLAAGGGAAALGAAAGVAGVVGALTTTGALVTVGGAAAIIMVNKDDKTPLSAQ